MLLFTSFAARGGSASVLNTVFTLFMVTCVIASMYLSYKSLRSQLGINRLDGKSMVGGQDIKTCVIRTGDGDYFAEPGPKGGPRNIWKSEDHADPEVRGLIDWESDIHLTGGHNAMQAEKMIAGYAYNRAIPLSAQERLLSVQSATWLGNEIQNLLSIGMLLLVLT